MSDDSTTIENDRHAAVIVAGVATAAEASLTEQELAHLDAVAAYLRSDSEQEDGGSA